MIHVWRLVTKHRRADAFTGEGARLYGGRWNRKGIPMIYTAQSQALAMVEMLVQDEPLRARYVFIPADIPESLTIERIGLKQLPKNWRSAQQIEWLREYGSKWALSKRTVVLAVLSAVVPTEINYLMNPLHPSFSQIKIGKMLSFITDPRLLRKRDLTRYSATVLAFP